MDKRESLRAALINKTAQIEGVSSTSVRRVLNENQNNDRVNETFTVLNVEVTKTIERVISLRKVKKRSRSKTKTTTAVC